MNEAVASAFEDMARMLELLGADRFRVAAHARAARVLGELTRDATTLTREELLEIEGIGAKTADKILEFASTGAIAEHVELRAQVPTGLLEILKIPGLGPKTVSTMWKDLGIADVAGLKQAIADGRLEGLPRMGAKTIANIKSSIEFMESGTQRLWLGLALPLAQRVVERMERVPGVERAAFAGSLRRGKETVADIDVLVACTDAARAVEAFTTLAEVVQVLSAGESRASVRARVGEGEDRWKELGGGTTIQIDLRALPPASWGSALMYFTGSKDHNIAMRERAQKLGFTLNDHGLFIDDGKPEPHKRGVALACPAATEEGIFEHLGVAYLPPEIRESRGELSLKETPRLIEAEDIRSELHAHTTESDGSLSLEELVDEARRRGMHTIAVTDHSKSQVQARGLSPERLRAQIGRIRALGDVGIRVLAGSEVDILADGRLDYDDGLLAELDLVVASPHAALSQDPVKATARLIRAIEHPRVRIIGHPTGRLINRRNGLSPAMDEVLAAAKAHGVAMEVNAHWLRLDLRDTHVRAAVEAGVPIAIDCDVHSRGDFDNIVYGVMTARRGWLTPDLCVNAWDSARLERWLART